MSETKKTAATGIFPLGKKHLPDILTDAPFRIEPGMSLPLVLFVRLRNGTPAVLRSVAVKISQNGRMILSAVPLQKPVAVKTPLWQRVFMIRIPEDLSGSLSVHAFIQVEAAGKVRTVHNSAYRGYKNGPLEVFRSPDPLPRLEGFRFGDLHVHNYNAENRSDTGVPLPASAGVARSLGLSFYAAALYSFNLHDPENGTNKTGWKQFIRMIAGSNDRSDVVILTGEEVTCRNSTGRNIRMLALNGEHFVSGTGDSPNRWLPGKSEYALNDAIEQAGSGVLAFALYPDAKRTVPERILLRRGRWRDRDLKTPGLTGIQISFSSVHVPDQPCLEKWTELLLKGRRLYIVAGSSAHGSLNTRIRRRFPFLRARKDGQKIFGAIRTGILCPGELNRERIATCLRKGRAVVTTGPLLDFFIRSDTGTKASIGAVVSGREFEVHFHAVSTPEFGALRELRLYTGDLKAKREDLIYTFNFRNATYSRQGSINLEPRSELGYVRGELLSGDSARTYACYTNPIWVREAQK